MFIFPIKSRVQILESRKNYEKIYYGNYLIIIVSKINENEKIMSKYKVSNFVRYVLVVTKKIHNKAVVRNKFKRRIKEAFKKIDKLLLKNKYDYHLIAINSIFNATLRDLIKDIEDCLSNKIIEKKDFKFKKTNNIKTNIALIQNKRKDLL